MNGNQSVFKDHGKKWKPRNKQAALIFTKAKPFHLPPVPEPKPVFVVPKSVIQAQEAKARDERIRKAEREEREHNLAVKMVQKAMNFRQREQHKNRKPNATWLARLLRKQAKQKGVPVDNAKIRDQRLLWLKQHRKV